MTRMVTAQAVRKGLTTGRSNLPYCKGLQERSTAFQGTVVVSETDLQPEN